MAKPVSVYNSSMELGALIFPVDFFKFAIALGSLLNRNSSIIGLDLITRLPTKLLINEVNKHCLFLINDYSKRPLLFFGGIGGIYSIQSYIAMRK